MTHEQLLKARELWKQTVQHQRQSEQIILKLLRHPDATPDQLVQCHQLTQSVERMLTDLTTALRTKFPPNSGSIFNLSRPWNNSEWDRYHRRDK